MSLFQHPARTEAEIAASRPLDISPAEVATLDEKAWYQRAYRGETVPQLTFRAVALGSLLGFLLAFTNLYIGLKTGWGLGVAITACIVSFSLWNMLLRVGIARSPLSILESNCMQSTASAAGYSTGSTMVSATPALLMISVTATQPGGQHLPWTILAGWTFFLALLGVAMAIPMKRNMINRERLRFPSGIAAAVTLQSLYSEGVEAAKKGKALFYGALIAALPPILMDIHWRKDKTRGQGLLPDTVALFDWLPVPGRNPKTGGVYLASDWNFLLDNKLVMLAAGALTGPRICFSMLGGGLLLMYFVGPAALANGAAHSPGRAWREIGIWIGAPMMISAGLFSFLWQWRTLVRAVSGLGKKDPDAAYATAEVPGSWFAVGAAIATVGVLFIGHRYFGIPWYLGFLAVLLTFFLSLVACRATGESDITPIGAMGKITQLVYGVLIPTNATANLMSASITANAAASSADLLTDLKSGYLLGADPRRQFLAQLLGIFAGTAASVIGFRLLVPDASALTSGQFSAPSAQAWLAVARLFQEGIGHLHPMAKLGMLWGLSIGAAFAMLETIFPRFRKFIPSPIGIGLGFLLPFFNPFSMLLGAVGAWIWTQFREKNADRYLVPISSGIIAGESIMSILIVLLNTLILRR